MKRVPRPGSLSTPMAPFQASTSWRAMARHNIDLLLGLNVDAIVTEREWCWAGRAEGDGA